MFDFWKKVCLNIVGASAFQPKELNPEDFYFSPLDFWLHWKFLSNRLWKASRGKKWFVCINKCISEKKVVSVVAHVKIKVQMRSSTKRTCFGLSYDLFERDFEEALPFFFGVVELCSRGSLRVDKSKIKTLLKKSF